MSPGGINTMQFVRIHSMKSAAYNGQLARVVVGEENVAEGRVPVFVYGMGKEVAIKSENLEKVDAKSEDVKKAVTDTQRQEAARSPVGSSSSSSSSSSRPEALQKVVAKSEEVGGLQTVQTASQAVSAEKTATVKKGTAEGDEALVEAMRKIYIDSAEGKGGKGGKGGKEADWIPSKAEIAAQVGKVVGKEIGKETIKRLEKKYKSIFDIFDIFDPACRVEGKVCKDVDKKKAEKAESPKQGKTLKGKQFLEPCAAVLELALDGLTAVLADKDLCRAFELYDACTDLIAPAKVPEISQCLSKQRYASASGRVGGRSHAHCNDVANSIIYIFRKAAGAKGEAGFARMGYNVSAPYFDPNLKQDVWNGPQLLGKNMRLPPEFVTQYQQRGWKLFSGFNKDVDFFVDAEQTPGKVNLMYLNTDLMGYGVPGQSDGHALCVLKYEILGETRFKVLQAFAECMSLKDWLGCEKQRCAEKRKKRQKRERESKNKEDHENREEADEDRNNKEEADEDRNNKDADNEVKAEVAELDEDGNHRNHNNADNLEQPVWMTRGEVREYIGAVRKMGFAHRTEEEEGQEAYRKVLGRRDSSGGGDNGFEGFATARQYSTKLDPQTWQTRDGFRGGRSLIAACFADGGVDAGKLVHAWEKYVEEAMKCAA